MREFNFERHKNEEIRTLFWEVLKVVVMFMICCVITGHSVTELCELTHAESTERDVHSVGHECFLRRAIFHFLLHFYHLLMLFYYPHYLFIIIYLDLIDHLIP